MGIKQTINTAKNTSPASIFVEERRQRALELRKKKLTLDAIAQELGCSRATAYRDVVAAKKGVISAELAKAALAEDMQTYGTLLATFLPLAQKGDPAAARIVLDTTEQRAKQLGTIAQPGKLNPYIPTPAEEEDRNILVNFTDPRLREANQLPPFDTGQVSQPEVRNQPPESSSIPMRPAKPANPESPPNGSAPRQGWKQGDVVYYPAPDDDRRRH